MNKRPSPATLPQDHAETPRGTSLNARVFPPSTPVDVPRLPPRKAKAGETDAGHAPVETDTEHNWADNTQPAPYKKKARTSIF
ncbi:hypothetical protein [Achromobacter aloeverae]